MLSEVKFNTRIHVSKVFTCFNDEIASKCYVTNKLSHSLMSRKTQSRISKRQMATNCLYKRIYNTEVTFVTVQQTNKSIHIWMYEERLLFIRSVYLGLSNSIYPD